MLPTHEMIDHLASRIEEAYRLRASHWWRGCSTPRVWYTAALRLWEAHTVDPFQIPADAELFVASQPISVPLSSPWAELAHADSASRYTSTVRRIVGQLRTELKREVAVAERSIRRGNKIEIVLGRKRAGLSPLGSYIIVQRAGRHDLAEGFAAAAAAQHRSCPLYRAASSELIPAEFYPDERLAVTVDDLFPPRVTSVKLAVHGKYRECEN